MLLNRKTITFSIVLTCVLLGFISTAQAQINSPTKSSSGAPIRFLLTFDDGPSASTYNNPSEQILDTLQKNPYQENIKAVFFTQTQALGAGGSDKGRSLLQRIHDDGHELAFHTATPNHANHRFLSRTELETSLQRGIYDLRNIRGSQPELVRPPFWSYDEKTLAAYHQYGLHMLLTDLSANDGVIYFFNFSFTKRSNMRKMLTALKPKWEKNLLPTIDGVTPIVVTFHDINRYTASHMEEYLEILLDVAKELEIPVSEVAFYNNREELRRAALIKTTEDVEEKQELPSVWKWIWSMF